MNIQVEIGFTAAMGGHIGYAFIFNDIIAISPRKRGRLKRIWMEVVRIDLLKCNLYEDLAQDRLE